MALPPKLTPVLTDASTRREQIREKAVSGLTAAFPLNLRGNTVEVQDVRVVERDFGPNDQKQAIMEGRSLNEPVRGTLVLKDQKGAVLERVKNFTLMHLPYFTERHTFVQDGNEYQVSNQIRMKPGVYTRRRANDALEASFNLSKGSNFRLSLDPQRGHPLMEYGTTTIPLYPVLRTLGVPHQDISKHWGAEVANNNASAFQGQEDKALNKLYGKLVHPARQTATNHDSKLNAVRKAYDETSMDKEVNRYTLGSEHSKVTSKALLDASQKLLNIYKTGTDVDDRDSLMFKTFHSVDDFIKERIQLDARTVAMKVKGRATNKTKLREIVPVAPFSSGVRSFLTGSQLSAIPTQINPMEMIDHAVKVTSLGEGGISSERAIPLEARQLHPTHFGVLDPVRTPESFKAGVDIRAALFAHRDSKGNLYTLAQNVKTKKTEYLSSKQVFESVVAFPNQKIVGTVDALYRGQVAHVPASKVQYQVTSPAQLLSPTSNLIPMIESIQGNRATMGSKMQTQALPLVAREVPYVQVGTGTGSSFEQEFGKLVVPTAPVAGRVVKVDSQYIYIDPRATKTAVMFDPAEEAVKLAAEVKRQKTINGITFKIELEPGDMRTGTSPEGKTWSKPMFVNYGYIPKTTGDDEECVDVYLKEEGGVFDKVFVVHQVDKEKNADEDKCMIGFADKAEAKAAYEKHGPEWGFGSMDELSWEEFREDYLEERKKESSRKCDVCSKPETTRLLWANGRAYVGSCDEHVEKVKKKHWDLFDPPGQPDSIKEAADKSGLIRVPYDTHFPFASKTSLNHDVTVKPGDQVSEDQALAGSNFTRGGTLALGRNMRVAYMAYYGMNSNDAVVLSEGAATKLTSEHMYKEVLDIEVDSTMSREKHRQYYGSKYTAAQYTKIGDSGVVKKGQKVLPHDPLIVGVQKGKASATDVILGSLKKSLANPFREIVRTWDHDFEGEVMDVYQSNKRIVVTVLTKEPMRVGDKLAGRYGNKGVVSKIIPDHQMIQDEQKRPVDVLYTSAGVISRINPAQVIETAVGKVAEKTGKPVIIPSFSGRDNVRWAQDLLKKHDIKDKETVFDPISGKTIPGVLVGQQYTLRLFKTTDSNFSARGTGSYDVNQQPTKGGDVGAKGIGAMEFNALIAHNARNVLKETATIKSQKNDEFWRAAQLGLPLPYVKAPFAYDKFNAMLQAAGIKADRMGNNVTLMPLTTADVTRMSSGAIQNEKLVRAKDLAPERGGLFDPALTGGPTGTRWTHIDLAEPVLNPVFMEPTRRLLGMTNKELEKAHFERGGAALKKSLNKIDVEKRLKELRNDIKTAKGTALDDRVKQVKYLEALKRTNLRPGDAYVMTKLPVLPPVMRPVMPGHGGQELVVGDSNYLYQGAFMHNKTLERQNANPILPPDEHAQLRKNLFTAVGAVIGTHDTDNPKLQKRQVKGMLEHLTGKTTPKCYDDATDILTEHGWIPFKDYVGGARVATVNMSTQAFEWQEPLDVIHEAYTGKMVHTLSRELDLCVTPNHEHVVSLRRTRAVAKRRTYVWTDWVKVRADSFAGTDRRRVMVGAEAWSGTYPVLVFTGLPSPQTSRGRPSAELQGTYRPEPVAFAEFVGWWVAEGWLSTTGAQVSICQAATSPHVGVIDSCMSRLGIPSTRRTYSRKDGYRVVWWTIKLRCLADWLRTNCGSGCENKHLSSEILAWPSEMLQALLNAYVRGDGAVHVARTSRTARKTRKRRKEYSAHAGTASKRLVGDLQHLAAKIGYHVVSRGMALRVKANRLPHYLFSVRGFSDVTIESSATTKLVDYSGHVHCVTVPNGTVVVRRNGKPAVSGNSSFFQKKIMKRQQDMSGRGTIAPDGSLGMDQVGIPEEMLWGMFGKFIIARLVRRGFGAVQAKEMYEARHPAARDAMLAEAKERPVMVNRAPTLHRYGIVGAYAVPVPGKTITVNPFIEKGMNADYDGDTFQVHAPILQPAVEEVKKMTLSNLIFGDKSHNELMVSPGHEAILGLNIATGKQNSSGKVFKFKTQADALAAYKRGEVKLNDQVEIKK